MNSPEMLNVVSYEVLGGSFCGKQGKLVQVQIPLMEQHEPQSLEYLEEGIYNIF